MSAPPRFLALRFALTFLTALSMVDLFATLGIVWWHAASPSLSIWVLTPMVAILGGAASCGLVLGLVYALLAYPQHRKMMLCLALIVLSLLAAHLYTINVPNTANCFSSSKNVDGCIMDEVYYVPAAQTLLAGEKCAPYADNCNLEHPWLSKGFIAAGISIFGNNTFGWRIFEVLLGTFSIPILFGICWAMTRNMRMSIFAAFLLAFETLYFVHSSIAVIDISAMFFGLLAFLFYFARLRWWKFGPTALTAISMGLAVLSKETAVMLLLVLAVYHLFFGQGNLANRYFWAISLAAGVFAVFVVGLQAYDSLFGAGQATTFYGQIEFILHYGGSLTMTPNALYCLSAKQISTSATTSLVTGCGWVDSILNTPITPLNWITYYTPIGYLVTTVKVTTPTGAYQFVSAGYYGVTDEFEVWLIYLWGSYAAYLWWKNGTRPSPLAFAKESDGRDFRMAQLALVWVLVILLAYTGLYFYGRITYPYYFIQAVPGLALGAAWFLSRSWFPPLVAYILLAGVLIWFFIFYPDKAFLPTQLRVLIGH